MNLIENPATLSTGDDIMFYAIQNILILYTVPPRVTKSSLIISFKVIENGKFLKQLSKYCSVMDHLTNNSILHPLPLNDPFESTRTTRTLMRRVLSMRFWLSNTKLRARIPEKVEGLS